MTFRPMELSSGPEREVERMAEYVAAYREAESDRLLGRLVDWLSVRDLGLVDVDEVLRFVATLRAP
jgi:hypothetical protein